MILPEKEDFEYPFSRKWVYASAFLAFLSITFTVVMLKDYLFAIILYFVFVSALTLVILAFKSRFYSKREKEMREFQPIEPEEKTSIWTKSFVLLMLLTLMAFLSPLFLSFLLPPEWWIIVISGFIPAMSIPEVILYLYSKRR
ncbi:MAG: hypothetical protein QXX08_05960 [Candidatus Bathyarchaeia archaeon]